VGIAKALKFAKLLIDHKEYRVSWARCGGDPKKIGLVLLPHFPEKELCKAILSVFSQHRATELKKKHTKYLDNFHSLVIPLKKKYIQTDCKKSVPAKFRTVPAIHSSHNITDVRLGYYRGWRGQAPWMGAATVGYISLLDSSEL